MNTALYKHQQLNWKNNIEQHPERQKSSDNCNRKTKIKKP